MGGVLRRRLPGYQHDRPGLRDLRHPTPLGPEADRVAQAGQHSRGRLRTVADDLTADVHRPEFPTEGNAFDPPIQTLYDDCY